jgi:hypothetical protein
LKRKETVMGNRGYVRITAWCVKCRKRVEMLKVKVAKELTKKGPRNVAVGRCACGTALRKIMTGLIVALLLAGCAGMYIEKHLLVTGENIKCVYGSGNLTFIRDVYFGRVPQNQTVPSFGYGDPIVKKTQVGEGLVVEEQKN